MPLTVLIAGLGAVGSAAAWALAERGARVVGFDRWAPPHAMGSSHGRSRIIREAYYEHPLYVPLVRRAYERWGALERAAGERLFLRTGGVMAGPPDGALVAGARRSAREHGIPHVELPIAELRRRWPAVAGEDDWTALLEPRAGLLLPERCIAAQLAMARRGGAALRADEPVRRWRAVGGAVVVETDAGEYHGDRLVVAAGAWSAELLADLALPLSVERQVLHWFAPAARAEELGPDRAPIALWEHEPERIFYTFPDVGDGVKAAVHHEGEITTPDAVRREATPTDEARTRALLARTLPDANGALLRSAVCLYTNTPDHHFLVDRHPAHPQVVIASACSGHGFKFASAVGEIVADLALGGEPGFDLAPFRVERFG
jgi:sarcosine oxidase